MIHEITSRTTQSYGYDGVNRLQSAGETVTAGGSGGGAWSLTHGYDQFGNMWVSNTTGLTAHSATPRAGDQFGATTNRLTKAFDGSTLSNPYDDAGNLINHPYVGAMQYDAENRQKQFTSGSTTATYHYDGDGRRVKRVLGGQTTVFVYDAFGMLAAEYSTATPTETGGRRYRTTDHLGSTRLVTDQSGAVKTRHDYLPFGEELPASSSAGNRNLVFGFGVSPSERHKFTGKERDAESGLDYFGARYMSSAHGRFTSPDPYNPMMIAQMSIVGGVPEEAAHSQMQDFLENPQNWNRYAYVRNNPLALVDPFGQSPVPAGHHLIPNRVNLGPIGTEFANAIRTGPLSNNYPNQPGFNTLHRAHNVAAEGILQQFERQFGASRSAWSVSQWRQAASGILNSQLPGIRNFLDLLNKNNAGKAIPALAAAISSFTPSAGLVAQVVGSSLLRMLRMPFIIFIDTRVVTDPERRDPEPDRLPPQERCLKNRDGSCVM